MNHSVYYNMTAEDRALARFVWSAVWALVTVLMFVVIAATSADATTWRAGDMGVFVVDMCVTVGASKDLLTAAQEGAMVNLETFRAFAQEGICKVYDTPTAAGLVERVQDARTYVDSLGWVDVWKAVIDTPGGSEEGYILLDLHDGPHPMKPEPPETA